MAYYVLPKNVTIAHDFSRSDVPKKKFISGRIVRELNTGAAQINNVSLFSKSFEIVSPDVKVCSIEMSHFLTGIYTDGAGTQRLIFKIPVTDLTSTSISTSNPLSYGGMISLSFSPVSDNNTFTLFSTINPFIVRSRNEASELYEYGSFINTSPQYYKMIADKYSFNGVVGRKTMNNPMYLNIVDVFSSSDDIVYSDSLITSILARYNALTLVGGTVVISLCTEYRVELDV